MKAIADSSFLIAIVNDADWAHASAVEVYARHERVILPQSALTEGAHLLMLDGGRATASQLLFRLPASRFEVVPLEPLDLQRAAQLLAIDDVPTLSFVDATVVAVAERLDLRRVLTFSPHDFQQVAPRHTERFDIHP